MITERESEILKWIEQNPMITQEELAQRAGIARSSVAVHISNLMKKGKILGKGYVVQKKPYVTVVGGANMDIIGYPDSQLIPHESNPGRVELSFGGVGRNQAHNLSLLDIDVKMISVFGEDMYAEKIQHSCRELGIDISCSLTVPNGITSTYLSTIDFNGQGLFGIADMEIYDELTPQVLESKMNIVNNARVCITETNLSKAALEYLAEKCQVTLFVEAISIAKAAKLKDILDKIHTLRIDSADIQPLVGYEINSPSDLEKAVKTLIDKGVRQVFVTQDSGDLYCADELHTYNFTFSSPLNVVNKTGARDSFIAALVWAKFNDFDLKDSARAGLAASYICMANKYVVNEELDEKYILTLMER